MCPFFLLFAYLHIHSSAGSRTSFTQSLINMHSEIISQYSLWLILPLGVFAALLSFFLYFKDEKLSGLNLWKIYLLAGLRFLSVFFITVFLLSIVFKYLRVKIEPPVILFVQDNSASLKNVADKQYLSNISTMLDDLEDDYQVQKLSFGEKLQDSLFFDFTDKETDFSEMFDEIKNKFTGYNISALIVASDGIYNRGLNPEYSVKNLNYPVYTIALGDSARKKDVYIQDVFSNPIAFSGDEFPVELRIAATGFKNQKTALKVYSEGKLLIEKPININSDDFFLKTTLYITAKGKGLQNYKIELSALESEYTKANNIRNIAIDIINDKKKVLILAEAPHPDIAALRKALQSNKNILTDYYTIARFNNQITDYQLIILYQLPDVHNIQNLILKIKNAKIPTLFVLGSQTNIPKLNNLNTGLKILKNNKLNDYAIASFNKQFNLFETSEIAQLDFDNFPPLIVPFGDYILDAPADVLLYQKIKGVKTGKPLLFIFSGEQNGFVRSGFICGENIWQWRMEDYLENKNQQGFDALINRLVHYLSLDVKKERFRIKTKRIIKENESVIIHADYYNKSYELNNQPEVTLDLINSEQEHFKYIFSRSGNSYILNAGQLPVGKYAFRAELVDGAEKFIKTGEFLIMPVNIELINTRADYALMYRIAKETGAEMFSSDSIFKLPKLIKADKNIKAVSFTTSDLVDLIELKWLLFVIVALLSGEWFFRKFWGTY